MTWIVSFKKKVKILVAYVECFENLRSFFIYYFYRFSIISACLDVKFVSRIRGFEDNIWHGKGELARSNAQLVEQAVRIVKESGREIATTGDHNMLILNQGKVIAAKSSNVKKGEFIPLPRSIETETKKTSPLNLLEILKNSKGIYVYGAEKVLQKNHKKLVKKISMIATTNPKSTTLLIEENPGII